MTAPHPGGAKRESQLRWESFNAFNDLTSGDAGLTLAEFRAWICLFRHARKGVVTVSMRRILEETRLSRSTVRRSIKRLIKLRFLQIIEVGKCETRPSTYRIRSTPPGKP
jgi:DNA-binding MarR family transcriptional regulator